MNFREAECGLVSSSTGLVLATGSWESSGYIEATDFIVFAQQVF